MTEREHSGGGATESCRLLSFAFFHLHAHINASISHACDVSDTGSITWPVTTPPPPRSPPSPTLKACQMLLGCHSEQPHDPDIQGFDLFSSKWQWSATAMFAWRCSVFLQYLLDLRLKLDLASTERQIEHLPRNATRVDQIYLFIYSFMFGLPSIGNPWSILMNSGKIKEKNKMILNMFFKA